MKEPTEDLKVRTKRFALRVIRMYVALPKNNTFCALPPKK